MGKRTPNNKAYQWIDHEDAFEDCLADLLNAEVLAIDTEGDNYYTYKPSICLIQIATPSSVYLLDTVALSNDNIRLMEPLLSDPLVPKYFHGADNDLSQLRNQYQIEIRGLFDTIVAARFLNFPKRGLGDLLEHYFHIKSSKEFQRYDWRIRPLAPLAIEYAIQDVDYLIELTERLKTELKQQGRLDAVLEESEQLALRKTESKPFDPHRFRRIKGSKNLTDQQLGVLYALYVWRHEKCTQHNRAAFLLIDNAALLELAYRQPRSMRTLRQMRKLSHRQIRQFGTELIQTIKQGAKQTAPLRPRKERKKRPPLSLQEQERQALLYDQLREWRQKTAETEQFEMDIVATNQTLQAIAQQQPSNLEELAEIPGMLPWRQKRFAEQLLRLVQRA